jgi:predicted PurR-regulated permease PerM
MSERPAPRFFLVVLAVTALLLATLLRPMASELFLAAVLAAVLWPLQSWLVRRLKMKRRGVAAGVISLIVVVLVLGPLSALVAVVIRDGSDGLRFISEAARSDRITDLVDRLPDAARDFVADGIDRLPTSVEDAMGQVGERSEAAAATVSAFAIASGSLALHATLMVIALFFFLARGNELVQWLDSVAPLGPGQTRELLAQFKKVSYAVIVSTLITAAVQAGAALIGFYIASVPSPIFFASVTFFAAFIPAIGAAVICLFAALLLFATGNPYMAMFLALWGILVVGLVDNLVKPLLIKRGMEIHGAVVFFSLMGGLMAFGTIGLLLGPLVVAMFLALLHIYHRDYTPDDSRVPEVPGT